MKTQFSDFGAMIRKSVRLYNPVLKQTFPVVFLLLLVQELFATVLVESAWGKELLSPIWANILSSLILFFCSVLLMGYLMTAVYRVMHQQEGDRMDHLRYALKHFSLLIGAALLQSFIIFIVVAFYVFLSALAGLEQNATQGMMIGFFMLIAFIVYTLLSQISAIVLFQQKGLWEALVLSYRTVKAKLFLTMVVIILNMIILLMPSMLFFEVFAEIGIESLGVQQVVQIFLSTLLMPAVQLILMHLYVFLFEPTDHPYQQL